MKRFSASGAVCVCLVLAVLSRVGGCAAPSNATGQTPDAATCAVTPTKASDPRYTVAYGGQKVGLCCAACVSKFNQDPQRYLAASAGGAP